MTVTIGTNYLSVLILFVSWAPLLWIAGLHNYCKCTNTLTLALFLFWFPLIFSDMVIKSSFYCWTLCKSLWITVSAKLHKWQCKLWMMIDSDRWKWCNVCLSRHSLIHISTWKLPNTSRVSYKWPLSSSTWLVGCLVIVAERRETTSSLTPYKPQMLFPQFPGFCHFDFDHIVFTYCQKPGILIWKTLPGSTQCLLTSGLLISTSRVITGKSTLNDTEMNA